MPREAMHPAVERDCLERFEIGEESGDFAHVVQSELADICDAVRRSIPGVRVIPGSNRAGARGAFSHCTFEVPGSGIDAVVVGVTLKDATPKLAERHVSGEIVGELSGDSLFETDARVVAGDPAMAEAVRDICHALSEHTDAIIGALRDCARHVD